MENTTNMVPVIKQEGTVLTDRSMDVLLSGSQDLAEAHQQIGVLQGKLDVAEQKLEEATKANDVIHVAVSTENKVYKDYRGWVNEPTEIRHITFPNDDITKIADAAVKAQALKDVEEANNKADEAKASVEAYKDRVKSIQERSDKELKKLKDEQKAEIEKAVKKAERSNLDNIADLEIKIKTLNHENDLMVDERVNLVIERNLLLEAKEKQLSLLKDRIKVLETPIKGLLAKATSLMDSWTFRNRIKRVNS